MGATRAELIDGAIGVGLAAGVAAVHVVIALSVPAPIVQPDELGYIDDARHLALGGIRPITGYYPGLSTLLAPVWKLTQVPIDVWRGAQHVNSACAALTVLLAWALVPRLSDAPLSRSRRIVATLAVSAYPALVLYSNLSLAESLFELGGALVVFLAWRAAHTRSDNAVPWAVLGLATGLLVAIHPRGLAVVIAVVAVAVVSLQPWRAGAARLALRRRPDGWVRLVGLVAGLVVGLALTRVALVAVRPAAGTGLGNYRVNDVVDRAFAPGSMRTVAIGFAGQAFYLTAATVGLAPLGIVLGLRDLFGIVRRRLVVTPAVFARATAGLASLGVLGMSVLFLNGGDRADQLIYGRYNEGVIVAPLVIAIGWLFGAAAGSARLRRCAVWVGTSAVLLAVGGVALQFGLTDAQRDAPVVLTTVFALIAVLRRTGPALDIAALTAFGAATLAVIVVTFLRAPRLAMLAVAVLFSVLVADAYRSFLLPGADARARQNVVASTIRLMSSDLHIPITCVGFDAGVDFTYFNDRFLLPGVTLAPFDSGQTPTPCGPFVISSHPEFFARTPGSQIVTLENDLPQILYVLPGPIQDQLAHAGWLLPADLTKPFPASAQRAEVTTASPPRTVRGTSQASVRVHVTNAGTGSPWPNLRGMRTAQFTVRLTARWFSDGEGTDAPGEPGPPPLATSIAELPRTLLPGQTVTLPLALIPRSAGGTPIPPGRYVVEVAVYQELVGTFPGGTLTFPITVSP